MKKFAALVAVAFLFALAAPEPALCAEELTPEGQRALKFLEAVQKGLRSYHIHGSDHEPQEYVKAAWEAMVRTLETRKPEAMEGESVKILIEALRRLDCADLETLVTLLDRFASRVEGVDVEKLAEVGAKGMFLPLQDPFSTLMDAKLFQKLMKAMSAAEDPSLGVGPTRSPEGVWSIAHVRGGYPAEEAGLKIGDRILKIQGRPVEEIPPTEVAELLKAGEGETVTITVTREGWVKPHTVAMVQGSTKRPTVSHEMLPGKIGYVRALIFNMTLAREVEKALDALEAEGMKALILDLRGNPGGALPACTMVADKFLPGGKIIATMESRHPLMGGKQTFRSKDKGTHPDYPMVVLIDKASASASEMLSGSLKNNERALVIGETSFGKGVGQSVVPVGAKLSHHTSMQFLYVTLMQYYLPGGTIVQHHGVEPDIEQKPLEPTGEALEAVWALREKGTLQAYAKRWVDDHADFFAEATGFAAYGVERFPGLVEAFGDFETGLDREVLLQELWRAVRVELEARTGENLLVKPREDRVLRRAVFELCKKIDLDGRDAPEYRVVFAEFGK